MSEENYITDETELDHTFNINPVVNGFADLKITCSVQRPVFGTNAQEDKLKELALNCAGHADITIIDWRLSKSNLHLAEDIIIGLLKKDKETSGRIRLICIYTAQPSPKNILNDIKKRIDEELKLIAVESQEGLACTVDDKARIAVFNKYEEQVSNSNAKVVPFDKLPQSALEEFSILVEGIIPRAALHSIAAVREQTHNLLALMNKNLDGAFCAHRALIPDVEDSADYILNLISQEISTRILCDEAARDSLGTVSLKHWYDGINLPQNDYALEKETLWKYLENGKADLGKIQKQRAEVFCNKKNTQNQLKDKNGDNISYSEAQELIKKGLFDEIKKCTPPSKNNPNKFAELFYQNPKNTESACNELSRLSCSSKDESDLRAHANNRVFLTLGSVLKIESDNPQYILCLQPPCDSVRLKEETAFLFLKLYPGKAQNADFVIKLHDEQYKQLSVKPSKKKPLFEVLKFTPDTDSERVLLNSERTLMDILKVRYKWVAELRQEKAQSIAQKVLTNASRIGLDEFEILRKKGSQI